MVFRTFNLSVSEQFLVGNHISLFLSVPKWHLNIHSNFVKKQCQAVKLSYLSPAPEESLKTSNQSLHIRFLIIYSTQCAPSWQTLLRLIFPKSFHFPSALTLLQRTDLYKRSQLCFYQHRRSNVSLKDTIASKGGKPGNHSCFLSWF